MRQALCWQGVDRSCHREIFLVTHLYSTCKEKLVSRLIVRFCKYYGCNENKKPAAKAAGEVLSCGDLVDGEIAGIEHQFEWLIRRNSVAIDEINANTGKRVHH